MFGIQGGGGGKDIRNSGIELLKIFGIFLIVLNHVIQTLMYENSFFFSSEYVLDVSVATTDIQQLILSILRYLGAMGNTIFFVCSAWFLLDSDRVNGKKWFFMLVEIWVVSMIILFVAYIARSGDIDKIIVMKCLMPTTFQNNWYMTCYLLFYPIHTILNKMIRGMDQTQLFRSTTALMILYIGFCFIKYDLFFSSNIILWITIYFLIAYIKRYLPDMASDKTMNVILLCIGIIGNIAVILLTNFLGLRISFFSDKLLHWSSDCNPFIICSTIALLNLVRSVNFRNRFINHISKLSMLIYIIHENIILRTYYRPYAINYIYEKYGYDYILLWIFLLSIVIFCGTVIVSFVYELTLRKFVNKLSETLYHICNNIWHKFEIFALKLH